MKKLILALTILMLVTVNTYAGSKPYKLYNCLNPEYKSHQKSNIKKSYYEDSTFGKKHKKAVKLNYKRYRNVN
jgi:uncharacterized membrane protein SpoIIM required for sporulation